MYSSTSTYNDPSGIQGTPDGKPVFSGKSGLDCFTFGETMPGRSLQSSFEKRNGYQGQFAEKDEETGYDQFEARLWDGRVGRWMTVDPAGQFHSPYLGMGNNPISMIDPDGRRAGSGGKWNLFDGTAYGFISTGVTGAIGAGGGAYAIMGEAYDNFGTISYNAYGAFLVAGPEMLSFGDDYFNGAYFDVNVLAAGFNLDFENGSFIDSWNNTIGMTGSFFPVDGTLNYDKRAKAIRGGGGTFGISEGLGISLQVPELKSYLAYTELDELVPFTDWKVVQEGDANILHIKPKDLRDIYEIKLGINGRTIEWISAGVEIMNTGVGWITKSYARRAGTPWEF